ncbi:uncharacterized protein LOC124819278 isoform X2 [Hydra vulgaris]|uniref:Uncharacterized protein LOC124819278 isoform X2 n=1 Tax=Hydra vulgaris TaxID=6087 RepID=A0ABM4DG85_HYDVU
MAKRKVPLNGSLFCDIVDEEGREIILEWSEKRRAKILNKPFYYRNFLVYTFTFNTLKSFIQNINFMVFVQMAVAAVAVFVSKYFNLEIDVNVNLFVSPIVFPLAFSINTDFLRREKVLDDLANFKAAGMCWFFCMRDWRADSQLDIFWIKAVHKKLKSMMFYVREYLLTEKSSRRQVILKVMYENFSDANQLIECVRTSKLPLNSSLVTRALILLNSMCLAFERLRVIREYRSPRSIRAFNKVFIFLLPVVLSPYCVFVGRKKNNEWSPYYISVLVAFVFSALQGVQDKLDNPFDGMSEDDINLSSIDEWTSQSLDATENRSFTIGRFKVETQPIIEGTKDSYMSSTKLPIATRCYKKNKNRKKKFFKNVPFKRSSKSALKKTSSLLKPNQVSLELEEASTEVFQPELHPYANVLVKIQGDTTILRGGVIKPLRKSAKFS